MSFQCKVKTAKILLAVFNVVFWVLGATLLVLGAWIFLDNTGERLLALAAPSDVSAHALFYMAYALLALGLAALLGGVLGCCGALQGSRCLLTAFFGAVLLVSVGAVALVAGALASRVQVLSGMQTRLAHALPLRYHTQRSDNDSAFSDAVDLAQYKLRCCGVRTFADYELSRWWNDTRLQQSQTQPPIVPPTCCTLTNDEVAHSGSPLRVVSRVFGGTVEEPWQHPQPKDDSACQRKEAPETARHKMGCAAALAAWYQQEAIIMVSAGVGSALFGLLGMVLAVCLCRAVAKDLEVEEVPPATGDDDEEE